MRETYNTEAIIASSLENVTKLKDQLSKIEQLRDDVNDTVKIAREIPEHFNKLAISLNQTSDSFIYKNYELLKEQIIFFQEKIIDLNNRITQIDEIDFRKRFENANQDFFSNLNEKVGEKINLFDKSRLSYEESYAEFLKNLNHSIEQKIQLFLDAKSALDTTQKNLEEEVTRLHKVNLEEHFNKHDKRLSDIFGATNNINSSLLNIANQTLVFQEKLTAVEHKFSHLESTIIEQNQVINGELKSIREQHSLILKKQNSNFTILVVLFAVTIIITVILHFIN